MFIDEEERELSEFIRNTFIRRGPLCMDRCFKVYAVQAFCAKHELNPTPQLFMPQTDSCTISRRGMAFALNRPSEAPTNNLIVRQNNMGGGHPRTPEADEPCADPECRRNILAIGPEWYAYIGRSRKIEHDLHQLYVSQKGESP
jgi:hypothetical protein